MIKVKKTKMGRPVGKWKPIILPQTIDVGYGPFQLRPDGSRDIRSECRRFAKITMDINGMSGQLND
jgi:hypothetical protein